MNTGSIQSTSSPPTTTSAINQLIQTLIKAAVCIMTYTPSPAPQSPRTTHHRRPDLTPQPLLLLKVKYEAEIAKTSTARITLSQTYRNPTNAPINLEYQFPINNNLVFSQFEAVMQGVTIKGLVQEKARAKAIYESERSKGSTVVHATISRSLKDVMTLQLGNLPASETITVKLTYNLRLRLFDFTKWELRIPATLTPRYLSKEEVENPAWKRRKYRINPYAYLSGGEAYPWEIEVRVRRGKGLRGVRSHSHRTETRYLENGNLVVVRLDPGQKHYPRQDFVLEIEDVAPFDQKVSISRISEKDLFSSLEALRPIGGARGATEDSNPPGMGAEELRTSLKRLPVYAAEITFLPDFYQWKLDLEQNEDNSELSRVEFETKNLEYLTKNKENEFIFIIDKSGSMRSYNRILKAKKALKLILKSLPDDSYFNVVEFSSEYQLFYETSQVVTEPKIQESFQKIDKINARGGTEIFKAYEAVTKLPRHPKNNGKGYFQRLVYLITDGAVRNADRLIRAMGAQFEQNGDRVFSLGIGSGASGYLVEETARHAGGSSMMISDDDDPRERIGSLLLESLEPILSDFRVKFDKKVVKGLSPLVGRRTVVSPSKPLKMYVLLRNRVEFDRTDLEISFFDSVTKTHKRVVFGVDLRRSKMSTSLVPFQMFTKEYLEAQDVRSSALEGYLAPELKSLKNANLVLALGYQVVSANYTSFICVVKRSGAAPKGQKREEILIPSLQQESGLYRTEALMAKAGSRAHSMRFQGFSLKKRTTPQRAKTSRRKYLIDRAVRGGKNSISGGRGIATVTAHSQAAAESDPIGALSPEAKNVKIVDLIADNLKKAENGFYELSESSQKQLYALLGADKGRRPIDLHDIKRKTKLGDGQFLTLIAYSALSHDEELKRKAGLVFLKLFQSVKNAFGGDRDKLEKSSNQVYEVIKR